jgi:GGDEF domain-containing protein
MANDDWDYVGTPVSTTSEPGGPALPSGDESEAGDATQPEILTSPEQQAVDELQENPEIAVFRRWRAQLDMPVEPYPDESERARDRAWSSAGKSWQDWQDLQTDESYRALQRPGFGQTRQELSDSGSDGEDREKWQEPQTPQNRWEAMTGQNLLASQPAGSWDKWIEAERASDRERYRQLAAARESGPSLPDGWQWMTLPEKQAWAQRNAPSAVGLESGPTPLDAAMALNQAAREINPGLRIGEDVAAQLLDMSRYQPTAVVAGTLQRATDIGRKAFFKLSREDQEILERGKRAGMAYLSTDEYQDAAARYNQKIEELSAPMKKESYQEFATKAVEHYEQNTPVWGQMALGLYDPTNKLLELPMRGGSALLNTRRVGGLEKAIAGLDLADDSYRVVQAAIRAAKAEGLGSKEASRILRGAEDLLREGGKGNDQLLKVLNQNKAAEVAAFTRDNLAGRTDEAKAILTEYVSKEKGVGPFDIPLRERWGLLVQPRRDDLGKISLIHTTTGLESRLAYDVERKPKGWLEAIINSRDLSAVNEAFGHAAGDDLLTATGKFVKAKVEAVGGRAFHHHGDEIRLWFPDEETAKRTLAAIDQELKERIIPMRLRDGTIAPKKGFSIAYGYGRDETAAKKALDAHKYDLGRTEAGSGRGILSRRVVDAGAGRGQRGPGGRDKLGGQPDLEARQVETTRTGPVAGPHMPSSPADEWLSSQLSQAGLSSEQTRAILSDPVRKEAALARARYLAEARGEILPPGLANMPVPTGADMPAAVEQAFGGSKYPASVPLYKRWERLPPSMKQQISRNALTDALTGLESRYVYELEIKPKGWVHAITDVNGLGAINKTFGQEVGNDLIARMGRVVKANVEKEGGRAFRYGGDEVKYWFPDEASARRALAAIDREVKERIFEAKLPDGAVMGKKGFTLSYGYGLDEILADKALNDYKLAGEGTYRAPKGVLPNTIEDAPLQSRTVGKGNRAGSIAAKIAGAAIATAARARHAQTEQGTKPASVPRALDASGALSADEPRMVLQYLRQQLSKLGYSSAMIDHLRMGDAAQIIAEGPTPNSVGAEGPSGQGSARGAAPGGMGAGRLGTEGELNRPSGRRPSRSQPPLSISQQMARLYRGTIAGDGYWGRTRPADHDAWAMVPDDLKGALEDYWQGENLTRHEVQRLMPVYRRYVAQTDYPGDMVQWITATLREQRYPPRRRGGRAHATTRLAA